MLLCTLGRLLLANFTAGVEYAFGMVGDLVELSPCAMLWRHDSSDV